MRILACTELTSKRGLRTTRLETVFSLARIVQVYKSLGRSGYLVPIKAGDVCMCVSTEYSTQRTTRLPSKRQDRTHKTPSDCPGWLWYSRSLHEFPYSGRFVTPASSMLGFLLSCRTSSAETSNQMSLGLGLDSYFPVTVGAEYPKQDRLGPIETTWTANEAE